MQYDFLIHHDMEAFVQRVNEHIAEWWEPLGGICIYPCVRTSNEWYAYSEEEYAQAIIKK